MAAVLYHLVYFTAISSDVIIKNLLMGLHEMGNAGQYSARASEVHLLLTRSVS